MLPQEGGEKLFELWGQFGREDLGHGDSGGCGVQRGRDDGGWRWMWGGGGGGGGSGGRGGGGERASAAGGGEGAAEDSGEGDRTRRRSQPGAVGTSIHLLPVRYWLQLLGKDSSSVVVVYSGGDGRGTASAAFPLLGISGGAPAVAAGSAARSLCRCLPLWRRHRLVRVWTALGRPPGGEVLVADVNVVAGVPEPYGLAPGVELGPRLLPRRVDVGRGAAAEGDAGGKGGSDVAARENHHNY